MPKQPDNDRRWEIIEITEPLAGLDEQYENDRALYADKAAERILGQAGRMIAMSKTGYCRQHPDHAPLFNANVCTRGRGKIWFGDLDLTLDEPQLLELAQTMNEPVYVLYERSARFFGNEASPAFDEAVVVLSPTGTVELDGSTVRGDDGRLRRRKPYG